MNTEITDRDSSEAVPALADLLPSTIIRAETALCRYPIHNLTRTEKIEIHIRQKAEIGETEIYWNVSPSREYGEPRQLAYKLDTLVVNRRIDEAGRPIPKLIRLGSLRDICKELDLSPSGDNFSGIRTALLQNASAFITAKLVYRGADRISRRFEAAFSRYSVVFTGEELPDNNKADAVYLFLNEHYWKLLNKVQFRPLDYSYQKNLKPAAHRFYELLSYNIYGALNRRRGEARLVYSDYCLRAPQERYFDRAQVQKQMYKIHKPHLDSRYLDAVRYEKTVDAEGRPDWEIYYAPGARARAQFNAFTGKIAALPPEQPAPATAPAGAETTVQDNLRQALVARGIAEAHADRLLAGLPPGQPVMSQLEWGDRLIRQSGRGKFRNPPGFYIYLLQQNVQPPSQFGLFPDTPHETGSPAANSTLRELEGRYQEYRREEAERRVAALPRELVRAAVEAKKAELRNSYRSLLPEALEEIAGQMARADLAGELPGFEQFCRDHAPGPAVLQS